MKNSTLNRIVISTLSGLLLGLIISHYLFGGNIIDAVISYIGSCVASLVIYLQIRIFNKININNMIENEVPIEILDHCKSMGFSIDFFMNGLKDDMENENIPEDFKRFRTIFMVPNSPDLFIFDKDLMKFKKL